MMRLYHAIKILVCSKFFARIELYRVLVGYNYVDTQDLSINFPQEHGMYW